MDEPERQLISEGKQAGTEKMSFQGRKSENENSLSV